MAGPARRGWAQPVGHRDRGADLDHARVAEVAAEIGGAWLIWQGVREHRGVAWIGAGIVALAAYGFVATLQQDSNFGQILAAYGGIFVAGSLAWGIVADGFKPDRWDYLGSAICLVGVSVIMFAPRT